MEGKRFDENREYSVDKEVWRNNSTQNTISLGAKAIPMKAHLGSKVFRGCHDV